MPSFDYLKVQQAATNLLTQFKQGTIILRRFTEAPRDPATPWVPGEKTPTDYALNGVVRRVMQKYVDGTTIVATDDQITFAVPPVTPEMGDQFLVDGRVRVLKDLRPLPAAGTPVAYIAFVGS